MSDQLVKARWFVKQEKHFPNVTFPKRRYNEYYFGFSLEEFINANSDKRPVLGRCQICTPNAQLYNLLTEHIFSTACSHLVTVHPQNTYTGLFYGMCDIMVSNPGNMCIDNLGMLTTPFNCRFQQESYQNLKAGLKELRNFCLATLITQQN